LFVIYFIIIVGILNLHYFLHIFNNFLNKTNDQSCNKKKVNIWIDKKRVSMYVYSLLLGDGIGDHSNFTTLPFCFLLAILCPCNNKALPLRALGGDLQSVAALSTLRHTVTVITVAAQPGGRLFTFRRRAGGLRLRPRAVRASPLQQRACVLASVDWHRHGSRRSRAVVLVSC
jgi:hypothetical protein